MTELGVPAAVRSVVEAAQTQAATPGRLLAATWAKLVHLMFLPFLDATRPWQFRYAVADGLLRVCQIAYRFDTIARCLGELKQSLVGDALRQSLCRAWVKALVAPTALLQN